MKRFTFITMLFALLSVTAFSQNNLVTPPANASVETWYTADGTFYLYGRYGWEDYTINMPSVNVAFDGDDLYLQGLSFYFPEGWIKGTINGGNVYFENAQFVGGDGDGLVYIVGNNGGEIADNIVFSYNAEEGILSAVTPFIMENSSTEEISAYCYWHLPVFTNEKPKGPEVVVAPENLVTDEWAISAVTNFGDPVSGYLNIGFDGNDVYLQGLCTYLPESWIKGTLNGTTITFPGDQYFGYYDDGPFNSYNFFLRSEGITFAYDAEAGKMTAEGEIYIYTGGSYLKGDVYNDPVITKVVEKAATPATPNISQIYDGTDGPTVMFSVPTSDVDGNAMASSKLSFQLLKDVEQEISPITFDPADYPNLTEAMSVLPYGFTDGLYFFPKYIILRNSDYSMWNKIGLQVIYTGGGEENKSEIFWFTIKEYEKATFDFNAMTDEPCSNNGNEGDITEDRTLTSGQVTLTVSPKTDGTSTPNRFWNTNNGPQLRVYSGTLTFEVPIGKVITKLVFNNGRWNEGNSADTGSFDGNVWTGYAQKVMVTIAGNTQLNSIEVYPTDYVPTAIEAPEGLVTDTYIFKANAVKPYYDPAELTLWVKVGFDGNDAYIQGLVADVNTSADQLWVKATKNEAGQYVIPANQFMGSVSFWMSSNDYFFTALDANGKMVDAVLDFNSEKSEFTTDQTLIINGLLDDVYAYQTFNDVVITKFDEVAATPADPTITTIDFGEWSHGINCIIPTIGSNGETLNPQKLFYTVWVEKNGEQVPYTFSADMYYAFDVDMSEVPYSINFNSWDGSHSIYFYDDASVFDAWEKVGVQSIYYGAGECNKSNICWIENPLCTTGISNINADQKAATVIFNLSSQRLDAPQKGLNIINGRKVLVK